MRELDIGNWTFWLTTRTDWSIGFRISIMFTDGFWLYVWVQFLKVELGVSN